MWMSALQATTTVVVSLVKTQLEAMNAPVWLGLNLTAMVTLAMVTAKVF